MTKPSPRATERLAIRPWRNADREPFAAMSTDPQVMAHLTPLATREASDAWIDRQEQHLAANGLCFWAVELKATAEFVGALGLLRVPYDAHFTPAVEIGWRLARKFWGQGFAPEAARSALRFGFEDRGLETIVANTVPGNLNSRRVMEKLGMTRDPADDFDHPLLTEDHPLRRQVLYRMTREAWRRSGGEA